MAHLVCGLKGSICVFSNLKIKIEGNCLIDCRALSLMRRSTHWNQYFMGIEGPTLRDCLLCFCEIVTCGLYVSFKAEYFEKLGTQGAIFYHILWSSKLPVYGETIKPKIRQCF